MKFVMEKNNEELDDALSDIDNSFLDRDFIFGFIIGIVSISLMIFLIFVFKNVYNVAYENFFIIFLPILIFFIILLFIGGAFKLNKKRIAYGIIVAIFSFPFLFFLIYSLGFLIKFS